MNYRPVDVLKRKLLNCLDDRSAYCDYFEYILKTKPSSDICPAILEIFAERPLWTQLHYDVFELLVQSGHGDLLLETFQLEMKKYPDDFHYAYCVGLILQTFGLHSDAITVYKEAIEKSAHYAPINHNLAVAYLAKNMTDEAEESAKEAVRMNHLFAEPYFLLATVCSADGSVGKIMQAQIWYHSFLQYAGPYLEKYKQSAQTMYNTLKPIENEIYGSLRKDRKRRNKFSSFIYRFFHR